MMWFRKIFVGVLLVCSVSIQSIAVDNFCGVIEAEPNEYNRYGSLATTVIGRTENTPSILRDLAPLRILGKLDTTGEPDLYYLKDLLDPDREIRDIDFGNSVQDERFRDYLQAKLLLKMYVEYLDNPLNKTEVIDDFITSNTSLSFQNKVKDIHDTYTKAIEDEFKNNQSRHALTLAGSFKESTLNMYDIFQSTGKAGIDILIEATYLNKLKELTKIKDIVYLLEEDYRDSGEDVFYLPMLVPYQSVLSSSQNIYQSVIEISKQDEFSFSSEGVSKLNANMNVVLKHIEVLLKTLDVQRGTGVSSALIALTDAKGNWENIENYTNISKIYENYLDRYDKEVIKFNILNLYLDFSLNLATALNQLAPEKFKDKVGSVLTIIGSAKTIAKDFAEKAIEFRAIINGEPIDTYNQIRVFEKYFDDWVYIANYNSRYYNEILEQLGKELEATYLGDYLDSENNIFITYDSSNGGSNRICYTLDGDGLRDELLDIEPVEEEIEDEALATPTLHFTLPTGAILDDWMRYLTAPKGSKISFTPLLSAYHTMDCIYEVEQEDSPTYILWYVDQEDKVSKSLELTKDSDSYTFSFPMPSSKIRLTDFQYDMNLVGTLRRSTGSCGLATVWESAEDDGSNDNDNTNNEIVNLTNGLVAHYELEGNANDSSGNGNDGTEYGNMGYTDGVIGQAGSFDGVDDYVEIEHHLSLNINQNITISTWVNFNNINTIEYGKDWVSILTKDSFVDSYGLMLSLGDDKLWRFYHKDASSNATDFIAKNIMKINKWFLVTVTYNGSKSKIYMNNQLVTSNNLNGSIENNLKNILLGKSGGDWYPYFLDGKLDDLRIYNRALNESEIQELYKLGNQNISTTLSYHDDFNDLNKDFWNIVRVNHNWKSNVLDDNAVTFENGIINLYNDRTDDGPVMYSKPLPINKGDIITVKRKAYVHTSNRHLNGTLNIVSTDSDTLDVNNLSGLCRISHVNETYQGDWNGFYLDSRSNTDAYITPIWDDWFVEELKYNTQTGEATYTVNDITVSHTCKAVGSEKNILFQIHNFGWYTGHYIKMDYIDIQIDSITNGTISTPVKTINLLKENYRDGTISRESFTKEWTFSQELTDLDISIVENSYQNTLIESDLIKDGKTLKVNLTPDNTKAINKLVLQFKNSNNEIVKVSGSETFWSLTKTNHAPRLADGQITQLVSSSSQPAFLEIATYDSDGDSVTLSVEDSAGGTVALNGNSVTASFSDGEVAHTIKIGLSDGKEKVIKAFTVLQFNENAIKNFYSDVDTNSSDYAFEGIAFGTLNGVIGGQIDPNDGTKRIFRPTDNASLAEALKMIINAEAKAGLIELTTADAYMQSYPTWAMKYYTFARESGAMDKEILDLSTVYPTREAIARMLVKTLDLDSKIEAFGELNFTFSDEDEFSDAQMRHYGEVAHVFGLFMLDDQAKPQAQISRAELAGVIQRIFMIPKAELVLNPVSVEQGEEEITAILSNVVAQNITASHELYDSSAEVTFILTSNSQSLSNSIDSEALSIGENTVYAFVENNGVRGVAKATVTVGFSDDDNDGIQNSDDKWSDDTRYAYDDNGNGIPDILDVIYDLGDYTLNPDKDSDGDGVKDIDEISAGTDLSDKDDYVTTQMSQAERTMFMILLNRSNFLNRDSVQSSSTSINLPALLMIEALKNKEESK